MKIFMAIKSIGSGIREYLRYKFRRRYYYVVTYKNQNNAGYFTFMLDYRMSLKQGLEQVESKYGIDPIIPINIIRITKSEFKLMNNDNKKRANHNRSKI